MIEISRNGSGRLVVNVMDIIKIVVLLACALVFYFTGFSGLEKTLVNHDVRIENNKEDIGETKGDVRRLQETKQDKKP